MSDKYLLLLVNQARFDRQTLVRESKFLWLPVNLQLQQTVPFKVTKTQQYYAYDRLTNFERWFKFDDPDEAMQIERAPDRPYTSDSSVVMQLAFERNLDMLINDR